MKLTKAHRLNENQRANSRAGYKAVFILLAAPALVIAILLAGDPAEAAGHFQRLKSFGFPDQLGTWPGDALGKDRNGYSILHSFVAGDDGSGPIGMTQGSDGAFYGVALQGGSMNWGAAFKLWPPELPILTGISRVAGKAHVNLEGAAGRQYQVLRSTKLFDWLVLGTISMPPEGVCVYEDAAPPALRAFYRTVWLP